MTTADSMLPAEARQGSPFAEAPPSRWDWLDRKLTWVSEYINPILVKETRQALKSRQFLITFSLLLIAGWGWSLLVVSQTFPAIYYAPQGAGMLTGYFCVLCFPLVVIVPFSAFRSLSGEREDGTFDLVSITTLRPRQIIAGKLGSAIVQMLIYISALAPAMTFTYMLRGVDILMILLCVFYTFLGSIALSVIGLLLATVTESRQWQMVLGVILILALVIVFWLSAVGGAAAISEGVLPYDLVEFWALQLFIITMVVSYTALFYLSAMARITFVSDNRSTKIRICLLAIQTVAVCWACWAWLMTEQEEFFIVLTVWFGFHWWLMGSLMVGESTDISPRVRRELPATFIGRAFSIWLYPGPGTGFMLMATCGGVLVAMLLAASIGTVITGSLATAAEATQSHWLWKVLLIVGVVAVAVVGAGVTFSLRNRPTAIALFASFFFALAAGASVLFLIAAMMPGSVNVDEEIILSAIFVYCYLIIYLGVTRLAMMLFDRFVQGGVFLSALLSILFVLCGVFLPMIIQFIAFEMMGEPYQDYTVMQVSDPFWTLAAIVDHDLTDIGFGAMTVPLELVVLVPVAAGMLLLQLLLAAREVDRQREATPDRVLEEERELHPVKVADEQPASPWDE